MNCMDSSKWITIVIIALGYSSCQGLFPKKNEICHWANGKNSILGTRKEPTQGRYCRNYPNEIESTAAAAACLEKYAVQPFIIAFSTLRHWLLASEIHAI